MYRGRRGSSHISFFMYILFKMFFITLYTLHKDENNPYTTIIYTIYNDGSLFACDDLIYYIIPLVSIIPRLMCQKLKDMGPFLLQLSEMSEMVSPGVSLKMCAQF